MRHANLAPCLFLLFALLSSGYAAARPLNRAAADPNGAQVASAARFEDATVARADFPGDRTAGRGQVGVASFYHSMFNGRLTANGERYDGRKMTAASRTLDFGTRVLVTNLDNGKYVTVTINDRGPYVSGRIIDLTHRAATVLGFVNEGITRVRVEPIL